MGPMAPFVGVCSMEVYSVSEGDDACSVDAVIALWGFATSGVVHVVAAALTVAIPSVPLSIPVVSTCGRPTVVELGNSVTVSTCVVTAVPPTSIVVGGSALVLTVLTVTHVTSESNVVEL